MSEQEVEEVKKEGTEIFGALNLEAYVYHKFGSYSCDQDDLVDALFRDHQEMYKSLRYWQEQVASLTETLESVNADLSSVKKNLHDREEAIKHLYAKIEELTKAKQFLGWLQGETANLLYKAYHREDSK